MADSGPETRLFVCPTEEQPAAGGSCVFCGDSLAGRRSREHVFARWLLRHYDLWEQPFRLSWTADADADGDLRDRREMPMGNLVAGRVCRACNNGWMSELEGAVAEPLIELAADRRSLSTLGPAERTLLARWAAKTAFAARSADLGPRLVPPSHGRALAEGGMPPVGVVGRQAAVDLGLGWLATQRWLVTYPGQRRDEVRPLVGRSHKTVLSVGRLVLAVLYWPDPAWPLAISRRSHVPLWPTQGTWLTYPQATDRHGVAPSPETELIDMAVGTRVAHPASQGEFLPVSLPRP